jgi:hypothetical protein
MAPGNVTESQSARTFIDQLLVAVFSKKKKLLVAAH